MLATFGAVGKVGASLDQIRDFAVGYQAVVRRFSRESMPIAPCYCL